MTSRDSADPPTHLEGTHGVPQSCLDAGVASLASRVEASRALVDLHHERYLWASGPRTRRRGCRRYCRSDRQRVLSSTSFLDALVAQMSAYLGEHPTTDKVACGLGSGCDLFCCGATGGDFDTAAACAPCPVAESEEAPGSNRCEDEDVEDSINGGEEEDPEALCSVSS